MEFLLVFFMLNAYVYIFLDYKCILVDILKWFVFDFLSSRFKLLEGYKSKNNITLSFAF